MIVPFQQIISSQKAREIVEALKQERFSDGKATAGTNAEIKNNQELLGESSVNLKFRAEIKETLMRDPIFLTVAMPRRLTNCIFSQYEVGMFYGDHVDNTIMDISSGDPIRADMSMTIFLEDPSTYDGGELVVNVDSSPQKIKFGPGDAVLYPTASLHRVERVTRGVRRAAILWIQSIVPDVERRQVLTDIWMAQNWFHGQLPSGAAQTDQNFQMLEKARSNLYRLWAEV